MNHQGQSLQQSSPNSLSEKGNKTHLTATPTKWLLEHDNMLKALVEEKRHSYAQIAVKLNAAFGTNYSRNATIGRSNRLGLDNTRPDQNVRPVSRQRPKLRIIRSNGNSSNLKIAYSVERDLAPLPAPKAALNLSFEEVTAVDGCRFITTADSPWLYCGNEKRPDSSFCKSCHAIVWIPPTDRNQRIRGTWR